MFVFSTADKFSFFGFSLEFSLLRDVTYRDRASETAQYSMLMSARDDRQDGAGETAVLILRYTRPKVNL